MGSKGIGPGMQRMCISQSFLKIPTRINVPTLGVVCTLHKSLLFRLEDETLISLHSNQQSVNIAHLDPTEPHRSTRTDRLPTCCS